MEMSTVNARPSRPPEGIGQYAVMVKCVERK